METSLVHGVLFATINRAIEINLAHRRSPNCCRRLFTCCTHPRVEGLEEVIGEVKGLNKLYASIAFGEATVARTRLVKRANRNPEWHESFHIYCAYEASHLTVRVKDNLTVGAVVVGAAQIPIDLILSRNVVEGFFDLFSEQNPAEPRGKISVKLQFFDVKMGLRPGQNANECDYTFFKLTKGNRITLYQDAHMSNDFMPQIHLAKGQTSKPARCWEDIYKAISEAEHLIYIAGWSVYTQITLVRDMERMIPGAEHVTLGQLLKRKAAEGVKVLLLVWDDRTSVSLRSVHDAITTGVMHTHDEDTEAYFQGSKVHCVLCPRNPDGGASIVQGIKIGLAFTHHQKTVVVDAAISEHEQRRRRKLVSFLGGLDLCDGRYDNQIHPIFRTLDSVYRNDFHQTNFKGATLKKGGPREPWHDVHSRIEGPAAWDVLSNFEQRWRKQGKKNHLLEVKNIPSLWPPVEVIKENDTDAWNSQIFRSIDEGAVIGLPENPDKAFAMGLMPGKENVIDRSIQDAYICAIRRAKHFVYMENQYFLGSSASWRSHRDSGAIQLIPVELTQKIISKIRAGERFAVYIVIPMWPEGVPEGETVQDILYWQHLTMEMMYTRIASALKEKGLSGQCKPTDYLNFFCLGNRESRHPSDHKPPEVPEEGTDYRNAQDHRRFMVYVHAKTMIVDDEYIIVGSANCNQRSMDGSRDSEIAVGAYQPHYIVNGPTGSRPRGQVHGFRMSLWYEHMGKLENEFLQPETLQCVKKVQHIAKDLWGWYTGEKLVDLPAHLLCYPMTVLPTGEIINLDGFEHFPDTKARVFGTRSATLPVFLTV